MSPHPLARLGWRAEHSLTHGLVPARVVAVDRGRAVVDTGTERWSAPLAGRLRVPPVTGDFAGVVPGGGPVRELVPRRGVIARRDERRRPQVLAANVDLALVATSLNRDLNPRRIARFIALTARGGVRAVVLFTKADLGGAPPEVDGHETLMVSARDGTGLGALREQLAPGSTAVLLGTSGVGKSTLVNVLLGQEAQATRPIRAHDDRGRHTTVRRELFTLPGGALLIDTPGLRLVAPLEEGDAEVPLLDKAAQRRERRARERAAQRSYNAMKRASRR